MNLDGPAISQMRRPATRVKVQPRLKPDPHGIGLSGGQWVPDRRGVMRWEQTEEVLPEPTPIHELIACPTCHARVDETCKTATGRITTPHGSRLTPRLCGCGVVLAKQKRLCSPCAEESSRVSKRDYLRRKRASAA